MMNRMLSGTVLAAATLTALTLGAGAASAEPLPLTPTTSDITGAAGTSASGTAAGELVSGSAMVDSLSYEPGTPFFNSFIPTLSSATGLIGCGAGGVDFIGCEPNVTFS